MKNIQNMTNTEFVAHLMDFGSKYGAMVQMVVIDCIQKGLDEYIQAEDKIIAKMKEDEANGRYSFVNMEAWVACCKETKKRMNEKYNPNA
jgi:polyhydroxyalkanoate synthesis regulator protein